MSDRKKDDYKPPIAIIPPEALRQEAWAFQMGKATSGYSQHSHREPVESYTRLASAALRHILAWLDREEFDPQSGARHLGHARANLAMLIDWELRGVGNDDRWHDNTIYPNHEDDDDGT